MLKYTRVKIELFKDVTMFDYTNKSILGGLCVASSQNIADNDDEKSVISSCDVCSIISLSIMSQKLPISDYKFVNKFDKNTIWSKSKTILCLLNVEIYTTKKVKDNKILSQFPALISVKLVLNIINYQNFKEKI